MKKYDIIYADPPWSFNNKNTGGNFKSGADFHYPTMCLADLKNLPIKDIAADNSILLMWWVASQPKEAIELVEAWGFKIKTMSAFNWVKLTAKQKPYFGMGFWTRAGSELCLLAVKGKPKRVNASVRSVVFAENEKHSRKPNVFREEIVKLMGEDKTKVELFARETFDGWDCWGNEVESTITI
ncbi:MAG TPA: MT-A70 family methyltransferase [Bacillota bacterium]|nr:MT-A70 family methyltransferase [Bacillota bacterium]